MDIIINIKTSKETIVRYLSYSNCVKWWENALYYHLQKRKEWYIGRYKLRTGNFSSGDNDLYGLIWRLVMWRQSPTNISSTAMEIKVILDQELEELLYHDKIYNT
ncbi:hypothetical protein QKU48_gp1338 [Fadolivirus algeromassiliense]|jgi:hypothetical protein|uniref:Uncharacterized protein n=1 Tax=Fadolivirus FV1/VV64 TaxID=3070911 RepID=A0A7D3V806_9VIRU|nr:hypothetical protein QKU48_gp1338 [Fadolivirus algeromassiliense]QKF94796.1 hypothetical protein Fadolivirus_1_1338 [Fadolivirus FV1/VV64]